VVGREGGGDGEASEIGPFVPPRPEFREGEGELGLRESVPAVAQHLQHGAPGQEQAVALHAAAAVDHRGNAGGWVGDGVVVVVEEGVDGCGGGRGGDGGGEGVGRAGGGGRRALRRVHRDGRLLGRDGELVHLFLVCGFSSPCGVLGFWVEGEKSVSAACLLLFLPGELNVSVVDLCVCRGKKKEGEVVKYSTHFIFFSLTF
jgi:hypothetical protein